TGSVPETEVAEEPAVTEAQSSILVVYFSATGTTRGVAERIAALTGGDLAEIVPAQPYTAEDLNYNDRSTRATVEQNTPDARPELADEISLDGYTTVYLGYPIWWGQAPRILSTFVESHDFTGITVIPFCTSGGSGAGRTGETLGEQAGTGTFLSSTRLEAGISDTELQTWIDR
ncbi:MAG: flavodoxin, partial [Oscillospiraceae bacterium]|nr:flavodoxin [Oscillospiraceae bacterium]